MHTIPFHSCSNIIIYLCTLENKRKKIVFLRVSFSCILFNKKHLKLSPGLQHRCHLFLLTYLWISPSITPRLTRRLSWCSSELSGGVGLCCRPGWRLVFWVGGESIPWWPWNVSCLAVSFRAFAPWLLVDIPVSLCGSSFFRRHDNWGLRRRTRVPSEQRILEINKNKK